MQTECYARACVHLVHIHSIAAVRLKTRLERDGTILAYAQVLQVFRQYEQVLWLCSLPIVRFAGRESKRHGHV
jgi:hypothetical protein